MRDPAHKIISLEQALAWRKDLRQFAGRLILTNGCFDLLHPGHVRFLNAARALGDAVDCMFVLLNSDASVKALKGDSRPLFCQADRAYVLASLSSVSAVIVFDAPRCAHELAALRPDVYVKSGEYSLDSIDPTERGALERAGSTIEFLPATAGVSTTSILSKLERGEYSAGVSGLAAPINVGSVVDSPHAPLRAIDSIGGSPIESIAREPNTDAKGASQC